MGLTCGSRYVARMPRIESCTDPRTDELPDTYTYDDARRVLDGTLFFSVKQKKIAHTGISERCIILNGAFLLFIFYVFYLVDVGTEYTHVQSDVSLLVKMEVGF